MPNTTGLGPRNFTSQKGTDEHCVTGVAQELSLPYDATEENGSPDRWKAVTQDANGEYYLTGTGEIVHGRLETIEPDQAATITDRGVVLLPYDGAEPAPGDKVVGGAADGNVKADATGSHRVIGNPTTDPDVCPADYVLVKLGG